MISFAAKNISHSTTKNLEFPFQYEATDEMNMEKRIRYKEEKILV